MNRKLMTLAGIVGMALSSLAFSGSSVGVDREYCPLEGSPACPQYPSCCK